MATSKKTPSGAVIYLPQSWGYFGSVSTVSRESSLVETGMAQLEVVKGGWYEIANKVTCMIIILVINYGLIRVINPIRGQTEKSVRF